MRAVVEHLARLRELLPLEPEWWRTGPVWSENELAAFEAKHFALPADYRAWLAHVGDGGAGFVHYTSSERVIGGMRALSSYEDDELENAARPFRIARDCKTINYPIAGTLNIGLKGVQAFLVVRGKRAGEVWLDATVDGGMFYRDGTFAELVDAWMQRSLQLATKRARPREPSELDKLEGNERWRVLCVDLLRWLPHGAQIFVDNSRAATADHERFMSAVESYTTPWLEDARLATTAAVTLRALLDAVNAPTTDTARALDAIFDGDPPDVAKPRVAALIQAMAAGSLEDRQSANWEAKWLLSELLETKRIDEALALFRLQKYLIAEHWVHLARTCAAAGRVREAFDAFDQQWPDAMHSHSAVRAYIHYEQGELDEAEHWIERAINFAPDPGGNASLGWYEDFLDALRKKKRIAPPYWFPKKSSQSIPPIRAVTHGYLVVALLFGAAGDGEHMADTAIRALSIDGLRRNVEQYTTHLAHARMGQALCGKPIDRTPLHAEYHGAAMRTALAARILERTGPIGVTISAARPT